MSEVPHAATASGDGSEQLIADLACRHAPVVFYLADARGEQPFTWVSPNFETITGHDAHSVVDDGDFYLKQIHPEDTFDTKRREDASEYRVRTSDGSYIWVRDEIHEKVGDGPVAGRLFGSLRDISAEKEAESERERLSRLLRDAVESSYLMTEENARNYYRRWAEFMSGASWPELMEGC